VGYWLSEPLYVNEALGITIPVPPGWKAWVEGEVSQKAAQASEVSAGLDDGGLSDAWRKTQGHTRPIIKLVAEPWDYPSIAVALLLKETHPAVENNLRELIEQAEKFPGIVWVAQGRSSKIGGVPFECIECLFESLGNQLFTRTFMAHWDTGMLSIKLVGDDREMVDKIQPVLARMKLMKHEQ